MIQTDCFAFDVKKLECNCLNDLYCKKENCKFYKSKEQYIKEKNVKK